MHAGDGAIQGTRLFPVIFPLQVLGGVLLKRYAWKSALLGAVVHQSILTNIEIAATSTTVPRVWQSVDEILLKLVVIGKCGK